MQLREKEAEAGDLLRWSAVFRAAADRHGALFVINDRPDLALAAGADGVHLGQNDLPAAWARMVIGPDLLIGLSTHAPAEFDAAAPEADYLCTGPVYETPTKAGRPATGLEYIRHAAARERDGRGGTALVRDRRHRSTDAAGCRGGGCVEDRGGSRGDRCS